MDLSLDQLQSEFDRQVDNLVQKSYPKLANISAAQFMEYLQPLRLKLNQLKVTPADMTIGKLPFVIVITSQLITAEKMMEQTRRQDKAGVTILRPHTTDNFKVIDSIKLPEKTAYLLIDIDRGQANINLPPNQAMELIMAADRTPLTIDEGIAIITHFPEFLIKNNCFSLLGSRTGKDQRVPAIWINSHKQPNLGWCWDGNPHTWLGSASSKQRIG